jgi:hypothetical protein
LLYFRRNGTSAPPRLFFTSETKPRMIVEPAYSMQVVDRTDAVPPISQIILVRGTTLIFGSSVDDNNLGLWFMSAVKLPKLVSILVHVDRIMLTSAEGLYQVLSIGMRVCVPALAYLRPP